MKGTLFSADFVKDSEGNLRLLELNTDTGFLDQELVNFNFNDFFEILSSNNITILDIIYKPYIHIDFVNRLTEEIKINLPSVTAINLHSENTNTIYPSPIFDNSDNFILRLAYDESALFDSTYCKNRLNVYNLFTENSILDYCVAHYHSSSMGVFNTMDKEINDANIPDATIKYINETFNPIDFYKIGKVDENNTSEQLWDNFLLQNSSEDTLIEQYHFHSSSLDKDNHITSIRVFGLVYGSDLNTLLLHSYKISSVFELPHSIESQIGLSFDPKKIEDYHYYEYTTNFIKMDSGGILSSHEILMEDESWKSIYDIQVGESVKSYYIYGYDEMQSDLDSLTWNYSGSEFPEGSYLTTSSVVYKEIEKLKYNGMFEMKIDGDSLFSGINKKYLIYDSISDKSIFKYISEINPANDYVYDINGNLIDINELNFYVTYDNDLQFVELDVENSDTYIINGSTAFNSIVSHNAPCFVAGTKILSENNVYKNIEDIIIGDSVISFDLTKNKTKISKVLNIFSKKVDKIVEYRFKNGATLRATLDHPIFVIGKGWCSYSEVLSNSLYQLKEPVKKIAINDVVKLYNNEVTLIEFNVIETPHTVYNLSEIETFHNYFANDVLVHNRFCFAEGTLIQMSDGSSKKIEEIEVGNLVISYNESTKLNETQTVINTFKPIHDDLVKYYFENGNTITCTHDHPFYVNNLQLASYNPNLTNHRYKLNININQIKIGDTVNLIDGSYNKLIKIEELEKFPTQTYIFEVSQNHNFYANGILTHNKSCFIAGTKVTMEDGSEKNIQDVLIDDAVLSYNEERRCIESKKVIKLQSPMHDDLVEYTLSNGTTITSTFDHPYYVNGLDLASYQPNWTNERYDLPSRVAKIKVGDFVNLINKETAVIISIVELDRIDTQTYIISVEDNRNFYANGILVHNK
jgi:intein/homing endonuclease